ncbi:Major intracellular serine protease precursor, putative [Perkinsus marinus ATCC 50983]|uniref:subtilisin n=1 Tax=Perkinsus marinus (strain ATCC 50983 / TXsc) TaxID=423536 RepID=C5KWU2_PERM5|nr:Major intracellular serine protease precursor, putative [Perkinsus marinus ATCC 50983]EER11048.1 Major intracellular serine protease precursor, putative [Perkinsus marinus ATCC 50983]|eukprot:XP_002779253.1 Major intracellular serine protease precursor, putative [Perkinsus marinus ATCC 50983]
MLAYSAFLSTLLVYALASGGAVSNRTLVTISYRGNRLDIRHVPNMMAKVISASGGRAYALTQDDHECERCFAQDGMVYDLKAIGIQIVESKCSVGHSQILDYLRKAEDLLDIEFECEPDSEVSLVPNPLSHTAQTSHIITTKCNGGNSVLGTNDPASSCQRNLEVIRLGAAWEAVRSAGPELKDVILAIIDSGVDMTHPDLVNQFWRNPSDNSIGFNFITNSTNVADDNGHGTHCAGNAAAQTNNSIGIAGVANMDGSMPHVKLMILKFVDSYGSGLASDAMRALNFAVENGAALSSHSYGYAIPKKLLETGFKNAAAAGHVTIVSAGNNRARLEDDAHYPCSYAPEIPSMLCIAASTSDPTETVSLASFSNAATFIKVAAPGVYIYSTMPRGSYGYMSGTSMSTPTTAGVAALLATLGLKGQDITNIIINSRTTGIPNEFNLSDIGEVDTLKAVQMALKQVISFAASNSLRGYGR